MKEPFRGVETYNILSWAKASLKKKNNRTSRGKLRPVAKAAKRIEKHLSNILKDFKDFKDFISNATADGFSSKVQLLKSAAIGFRKFENHRIRILLFCGRLKLEPNTH